MGVAEQEDLVEFARERLGFLADEQQAVALRWTAKRVLLACSRQWGKSTVGAIKAVHRAWSRPGSLILVASPCERQSGEFLRKAADFVRRLAVRPRGDGCNEMSIALPNGSRIVGLPGSEATVRGYSAVSLLLVDEAARVMEDVYKALRPVLAVAAGDMWLMSTPFGRRGFFYEQWVHGGARWERMAVKATECGRIPAEFLEEEREALGRDFFGQEYLCEFVDGVGGIFERALVEGAVCGDVRAVDV